MSVADTIQDLVADSEDLVSDAEELDTDIGNAYDEVQTKGGTVPQNKNTNNLAPAIRTIPTGITPTGQIVIEQNGTYDVTDYASASVDVPNDDTELVGLITKDITSLSNSTAEMVKEYTFYNCSNLLAVNLPNVKSVGERCFYNCTEMTSCNLGITENIEKYGFYGCQSLEILDLKECANIGIYAFNSASKLQTIILRGSTVCVLANRSAFMRTPFDDGSGGTVYVPQALVNDYQNATNWSYLQSTTFLPIEGSEYE